MQQNEFYLEKYFSRSSSTSGNPVHRVGEVCYKEELWLEGCRIPVQPNLPTSVVNFLTLWWSKNKISPTLLSHSFPFFGKNKEKQSDLFLCMRMKSCLVISWHVIQSHFQFETNTWSGVFPSHSYFIYNKKAFKPFTAASKWRKQEKVKQQNTVIKS